jgi:hypothetical protein
VVTFVHAHTGQGGFFDGPDDREKVADMTAAFLRTALPRQLPPRPKTVYRSDQVILPASRRPRLIGGPILPIFSGYIAS